MNLKMVGLITNYLRNARFKGAVRAILFRGDLISEQKENPPPLGIR